MIWQLDAWLLVLLTVAAVAALRARDLVAAVVVLTVYSFLMALLFAELGAVDVAFTEATLGAGVTGAFFLVTLFAIGKRSEE